MKLIRHIFACLPIILAGCTVTYDHHYPKLPSEAPPTTLYDVLSPLTPAEVETVKKKFDYFQPYMTQDECWKILDLPKRQYPTSVSGERPAFTITMTLREGSILAIVFDRRGYVVFAQLGDKKWEWKPKPPEPT
ncbi:MAG TPA: hypothetical protein VHX90_07435 [Verrucomicrobiae bacterium]|nr:hypothetical protein [Verrucomicrobiae bacterium]